MRFLLARTDPVQQIAAHPTTLAAFVKLLRQHAAEPDRIPALRGFGLGLPLIPDEAMAADVIHLRPTPKRRPFKLHLPHHVFDGWEEDGGRAVAIEDPTLWITTEAPSTADLIRGYGDARIEWLDEEPPAQNDQ
ncbi:hypothetical protein [Streptomyces fructofermentans]|uniref:Uncharacterized protein n=1 Tax=Streptomyces fructofermentans TaxID=152141 RepID=A0A918NVU7_9ACTN|nr:hypothetical protein [Streptomyces fructofermentans]GGX99135.1 hypothetical protein GCM10010515_76640 [Streptomyces fructofermentans]